MRLHYLQHVPTESPGNILAWAAEHGHQITHTLFYQDEPLPDVASFDWLVIMGGPMNVYEEDLYPWLSDEKGLIREAIAVGKVVLGFCLGSQLIADAIGGKVTANDRPEIGWHRIEWTDMALANPLFSFFPRSSVVFQWHNDTFSVLPPGAVLLAGSEACEHQAFIYREKVFGFQFHLENTSEMIRAMALELPEETGPTAWVQTPEEMSAHPEHIEQDRQWLSELLTRLEARTEGR
jgi:GMP synthase-like glutamine amidotransferase